MSMMRVTGVPADPYIPRSPSPRAHASESSSEKAEECGPSDAVFLIVNSPQEPLGEKHPLERDMLSLASLSEGEEKEQYIAALKDWMGNVLQKFQLSQERINEILQKEKNLTHFFYIAQHGIHFIAPVCIDGYNQRCQAWGAAVKILGLPIDTFDPFQSIPRDFLNYSQDQSKVIQLLRAATDIRVSKEV